MTAQAKPQSSVTLDLAPLEERVDRLFDRFLTVLPQIADAAKRNDTDAQVAALKEMQPIRAGLLEALSELQSEIARLHERAMSAPRDEKHVPNLVQWFKACARIDVFASDILPDVELVNACRRAKYDIVQTLDTIPPGRKPALQPLLTDSDPGVRIDAAIFLLDVMPDQVLPLLRDVDVKKDGLAPTLAADFALLRYKVEHPVMSRQADAHR